MKNFLGKRLLSFLLAVVMVLSLIPAVASPKAEAQTATTSAEITATKNEIIKLRNYAETLGWPVAVKTTGLSTSTDMTGHWMILVERSGGQMYTVNMSARENMCVENNTTDPFFLYGVTFVTGNGAVNELHSMPEEHVLSLSGTIASFSIRNYKKDYWKIDNKGNGSTDANKNTNYDLFFTSDSNSATRFMLGSNGTGYNIISTGGIYIRTNGHSFQAGPSFFGNPTHFYKFSKYTINLRLSMLDALPYLIDNSKGRFTDAEAHKNLIATMREAVEAYTVHYDTTESNLSAATKAELERLNTELQSSITALRQSDTGYPYTSLRNNINSALWPYAELIVGKKENITAGHYMILTSRSDLGDSLRLGVNSDDIPGGWTQDGDAHITRGVELVTKDGTVLQPNESGGGVWVPAAIPGNQRPIVKLSGTYAKFTLQHYNGLYWYMTNNTHWYDKNPSPPNWGDFWLSTSATEFWLENHADMGVNGVGFRIFHTVGSNTNIIYANGYTYRTKLKPTNTSGTGYNLEFYRFNEEAIALRLALQEGLSYLVEDYATRFDETAFEAMCVTLDIIRKEFIDKNVMLGMTPSKMTEEKKRTYKSLTEEILDAIAAVQRTDNEGAEYIDIPIEILDFRGDTLLFEGGLKSPYALNALGVSEEYAEGFPGKPDDNHPNDEGAVGLTTGTLVDGNVVYTQKTVDYIAKHLYAKSALDTQPTDKMNRVFYDLIQSNRLTYSTDGYAQTIAKCVPPKAGGRLSWGINGTNITTYHDLAYYLLSNLWRPSEDVLKAETLPNGKPYNATYNMVVPELNTMRMFKGSDGLYSFLSDKMSSAADGYIQNVTDKALTLRISDPKFQPINNLGFESAELYGTATESRSDNLNNYLFTLHAYGSFIYTEDADLNFSFTGDDDVYFFVNDVLICDIGGLHHAVTRNNVKLNNFADELQLTDGQICHFDMFYAERHTTGINLNFSTNIKIMDENVVTDKQQYDPAADKPIMDGAVVPTGKEIAYSFGLTNRRNLPAHDLLLTDIKLGVTLDGNRQNGYITLNPLINADVTRYATDLTLVYSAYDRVSKTVSTQAEQPLSFTQMRELIQNAAVVKDPPYTESPLGSGVYSYKVESEEKLLSLLQLGLPAYCKLTVKGFRHRMETGEFTNSLSTSCTPVNLVPDPSGVAIIEYGDPIYGTASCKCKAMNIPIVSANDPYAVVLDYGKGVEVDLSSLQNTFTVPPGLSIRYVGAAYNGVHDSIKTQAPLYTTQGQSIEDDTALFAMVSAQTLRFTSKCFMEGIRNFYAVYHVTATNVTGFTPYYIFKAVSFLPANMVYYEAESFLSEISYKEKRSLTADNGESEVIFYEAWGQEGASGSIVEEGISANDALQTFKPVGQNQPYGYDPSYGDDSLLSNGKSLYVEGAGYLQSAGKPNDNYTQITFSFVGSGFDLISRTDPEQGAIRVSVYTDKEMTAANRERALTIYNSGELNLYQIPVVSVRDLIHGRYYVSVEVNDKVNIPLFDFSFGNQFYLDAIRIYEPMDTKSQNLNKDQRLAYHSYYSDEEARPFVKEIRDSLLDGAKTEGLTSLTEGAMFVDAKEYTTPDLGNESAKPPTVVISEHLAVSAATYEKVGPKNEVYLSPGQAVAFKLELADGKVPIAVHVGAKTIMGDTVTLAAGFVGSASTEDGTLETLTCIAQNLVTSTAMYYALNTNGLSADNNNYLVIYNALDASFSTEKPSHVLSVTDLKVCYAVEPVERKSKSLATEPYYFAVDNRTLEAAAVFMRAVPETPILDKGAKIMHSLNLAGDLSINYVVEKSMLEACDSLSMEVEIPVYEGSIELGTERVSLSPEEKGAYYYFTLNGITAVQMKDDIEAVLHWEKDGLSYYSPADVYSVAQYAYSQLSKDNASDTLKTLCADLLVYGGKAQSFKGYRVDDLADSAMTETQRAYCTDPNTVTFGYTKTTGEDLEKPTVTWVGNTLNLGSKVSLKFVFDIRDYSGALEDLSLRVSYRDLNGQAVTATLRELESYNVAEGQYAFSFDGLLAAELRSVVSAQIYGGNEPVSCTLKYSADTYCGNKTGALGELCKALFAYSDSAKAYFLN